MRINTNVSALNTQRQLGITNQNVSNSITRLSSGFRINRAADDAAGLGIANKLRGDIRSMTQAVRNGEQANSLAQIAEGAVGGIATMLDRMKELATQANSSTVDSGGRERLQAEFNALRTEIDRTANTTKFGETSLIAGGLGASLDTTQGLGQAGQAGIQSVTISGSAAGEYAITVEDDAVTMTRVGSTESQTLTVTDAQVQNLNFSLFGINIETSNAVEADNLVGSVHIAAAEGGSFMVSSSGSYGDQDLLSFSAVDMRSSSLGLTGLDLTADVAGTNGAQAALEAIDDAMKLVNTSLGDIGAFQNQIENAIANTKTAIENLSASESVIRDLDMAEEMTKFSKNQILQQAGTAMLAQANSASQGVLQLLRG